MKVKLPARIIYQVDLQISNLEKLIAKKQRRLAELKSARALLEKENSK